MDESRVVHLRPVAETRERTLLDIAAAIELVAADGARRMILSGLPDVELVAADALALAQASGVAFSLARHPGARHPAVIVGPKEG